MNLFRNCEQARRAAGAIRRPPSSPLDRRLLVPAAAHEKTRARRFDWIAFEPAIIATHPISIVDRAPHPNAARLFIDFALSDEEQKIFVQRGRESAKPGLRPEGYPSHLKVFPSRVQLAEKLEEYSRRYRELFVR